MSLQRIGKYACLEIERCYLLRELPADLLGQGDYWQIVDRYILDTRLRLRQMTSPRNQTVLYKFSQKLY